MNRYLRLAAAFTLSACGVPDHVHKRTLDELAQLRKTCEQAKAERDRVSGELTNAANKATSLEQDVAASKAELDALRQQREQYEQRMKAFRELALKLKSMVDAGKIQVQIRKGRMLVRLPDHVLFAAGSATLKKEGQAALAEVSAALKEIKDRDFVVTGHTDNLAIATPRFPSNWELSSQRAIEVAKFMIAQGMQPKHVSASGYGEFDPIASNDSAEKRQANRRIEIVVMPKIEELPKIDELPNTQ